MPKNILSKIRSLAFAYIYVQALVIFIITCLLFFWSTLLAFSFFWGGIICILPNAYLAHKLFAKTGANAARQIVTSFYLGETVKFIITIILFIIAFKYFNVNKLAVFIGYIIAQVTFWVTALMRDPTVNKL